MLKLLRALEQTGANLPTSAKPVPSLLPLETFWPKAEVSLKGIASRKKVRWSFLLSSDVAASPYILRQQGILENAALASGCFLKMLDTLSRAAILRYLSGTLGCSRLHAPEQE